MEIVIILAFIYLAFHLGHAHSTWRRHRRLPWHKRIWVSVPGPFNTRISKRFL